MLLNMRGGSLSGGTGDSGRGSKSSRGMCLCCLVSRPGVPAEPAGPTPLPWSISQCPIKPATYMAQCEAKAEEDR